MSNTREYSGVGELRNGYEWCAQHDRVSVRCHRNMAKRVLDDFAALLDENERLRGMVRELADISDKLSVAVCELSHNPHDEELVEREVVLRYRPDLRAVLEEE